MATQPKVEEPEIDVVALKAKYREERDKRVRVDGDRQYVEVSRDFAHFYEDDPHSPPVVRDAISEDIEVIVLGGGFSGLLAGAHLQEVGIFDFRIIEMGGDFGGTWYWNRYPGVQCDIEAYCYLPLLEELNYVPKEKYSYGPEIYEHCQRIGRHYNLYERALFGTQVTALRWDEAIKRWHVGTNRGDDIRTRFIIMGTGNFNRAKLPGIPGIQSFKGHSFHTSRWDYDYTGGDTNGGLVKLKDKRVAIIGTGATGIQCIPHLGRWAKQLYVLQRTPSVVDLRRNEPTDLAWAKSLGPGWQKARRDNFNAILWGYPVEEDLVQDGVTEIRGNVLFHPDRGNWTPEEVAERLELEDFKKMQRLRDRIDEVVVDPGTADALKAWYRWNCKRPTFNDDFLPTFNRPTVTLIDVSASKGVDRITQKGVVANGEDYEVDCIIYASGFEITSEMKRTVGIPVIEGRRGVSLYDHWKDGFRTLHGFTSHNFPNMFQTGYTQTGVSANLTSMLDEQTEHIAYILKTAKERGAIVVECSAEAEEAWRRAMRETDVPDNKVSQQFLLDCTPGYYNNEGGDIVRLHIGEVYGRGLLAYNALLADWRNQGELAGLNLES
jgi:cyclohexanone monooxygenase